MTTAEQVTEPVFELAEGPVWDAPRGRLLWIDILGKAVHTGRLGTGSVEIGPSHHFESYVGAVAVADDGALLVAEHHHLTRVAPDGSRTSGPDLFADHPNDRWNDGTCDARGRFLIGTASLTGTRHSQRLLRVDGDTTTVLDDDLGPRRPAFDLDQLLITTARGELSPAEQDEHPLSGSLFLTRPGCTGLPTHTWSGLLTDERGHRR